MQIYNFAMNNAGVKDLFDDQSTAFKEVETDLVANYSLDGDGADATQYNNDAVPNAELSDKKSSWFGHPMLYQEELWQQILQKPHNRTF
ncbi:MAG: hypothetical protein IPL23_26830 [Saprospiraceae bacterium]|nr:hypothetical protein [Saprospiraceae bacterium]